jgi:acetyl-CoA acyltransferase 2
MSKNQLVFLGAKRTAFGALGGSLSTLSPTELGILAGRGALEQAGVSPDQVDHVIVGNVLHSAPDSIYSPRHIGLKLGIPIPVPALGVNRLCGSGFQAIIEAALQMNAGDTDVALVGGIENMSLTPYVLRGARFGYRMGNSEVIDQMTESLTDLYAKAPMAITAENLAVEYKISREESDLFALASQKKAFDALQAGRFDEEITTVMLPSKKGDPIAFSKDEHPKPQSTLESISKLKPIFKKDGVVTAANASGIVDGASMLVVATEAFAEKAGLKPLGRLVSYGVVGCEPTVMGIGPVPASKKALERAGMKLEQMDLIEVNEAFAPQALAVQKALGINSEIFNVNGGAIAIGHPLAASGSRIVAHLLYELRRRKKRFGLGSACIGGGQGIAMIVEAF